MANTLSLYCGTVTQGGTDGDLVTNTRRITLSGLRSGQPSQLFAMRAESASYPAANIHTKFSGTYAQYFEISRDNVNWGDVIAVPYVGATNVLFWIRCKIPDNMPYGVHTDTYLTFDYKGGI